jgi:hypothetical protein
MAFDQQEELERLIDGCPLNSLNDWRFLKELLSDSFAAFLGQHVEPVWEPNYEHLSSAGGFLRGGYSFAIRSGSPLGSHLEIEWYGVVGHTSPDQIYSILLLFAEDRRLVPIAGGEYLFFEFVRTPAGSRRWVRRGWQRSEFDEWEGYRRLTEVVRDTLAD